MWGIENEYDNTYMEMVEHKEEINDCVEQYESVQRMPEMVSIEQMSGTLFSSPFCPPSQSVAIIIDRSDGTNMGMVEPKEEINHVEQNDSVQRMPETMSGDLSPSPLCPPSHPVDTIIDRLDGTNIEMVEPKKEINNCVQEMPDTVSIAQVLCPVHPLKKEKAGPKPKGKGGHARCICGKTKRYGKQIKGLSYQLSFSRIICDPQIEKLKRSQQEKQKMANSLEHALFNGRKLRAEVEEMRRRAEDAEQELHKLKEKLGVWDGEQKLDLTEHCMEHIVKFRQLGVPLQKLPAVLECAASFTRVKLSETPCLKMCRRALALRGKAGTSSL